MFDLYISQPVGRNANNSVPANVKAIQSALFRLNDPEAEGDTPFYDGVMDGWVGDKTIDAIARFQDAEGLRGFGKIDPCGPTIKALQERLPEDLFLCCESALSDPTTVPATIRDAQVQSRQFDCDWPLSDEDCESLARIQCAFIDAGHETVLVPDTYDEYPDGAMRLTLTEMRLDGEYPERTGDDLHRFQDVVRMIVRQQSPWVPEACDELVFRTVSAGF